MIESPHFKPGTQVGCTFRCPGRAFHPDCWEPPWVGTVLACDDPRIWTNTVAFPRGTPSQQETTAHVESIRNLLTGVPILYSNGKESFTAWDLPDSLRPYNEALKEWTDAREAARKVRPSALIEQARTMLGYSR